MASANSPRKMMSNCAIALIWLSLILSSQRGSAFIQPLKRSATTQYINFNLLRSSVKATNEIEPSEARKSLWKEISKLEKQAVELLSSSDDDNEATLTDAMKLLSKSVGLKRNDPFLRLANEYSIASEAGNTEESERLLAEMRSAGLPPHISELSKTRSNVLAVNNIELSEPEDVDPGSTFSDTVTEKVRVKVNSFYDEEKSDPANGKYMFWYKVAIYNEGPEPVQIVARMWEIEKCIGEKEVVRGAGIMSTQPIIPPGDVFTYQSVCPLKVFPPRGKRVLGSLTGSYTMCKGNMGQHNFNVKVGKFNLILPEKSANSNLVQ